MGVLTRAAFKYLSSQTGSIRTQYLRSNHLYSAYLSATNTGIGSSHINSLYFTYRKKMEGPGSQPYRKVTAPSKNPIGDVHGAVIGDPRATPKGVIVIHEWWGMNDQILSEAAEIARDGKFTVFVPDLYRGKVATDNEEAGHYMGNLDWKGAVQDISASATYLKGIGCSKVGVMGFCMGGALTFAAAAICPEISAAAPFYGIPKKELADLTTVRIPVQGHYGDKDELVGFSAPSDFYPLRDKLIAAKVQFEMFTYPTGHAFTNPSNPNYSKEIAELALNRVYQFMQRHLS